MNGAHLHLLLNHLPVVGTVFALGLLGSAMVLRKSHLVRAGLWSVLVAALLAIPAYMTGEPAEDVAERLPGVTKGLIEEHEEAAGYALGILLAAGVAAGVGIVLFRGQRPIKSGLVVGVLALTVIAAGTMARTANLGGAIRHTEIR
jgi:uncharacterized membrane protein